MCGIAGFFFRDPPGPERDCCRALSAMRASLHHRGPDDSGLYVAPDDRCGLTAARLAILDLSAAGHQPMRSGDGRHVIVFNGEIYNFRTLRAELEAKGETFQSGSDTEVVLRLYQREGREGVRRLRGMFAFAILDESTGEGFLARDPLGIKPLYVYHDASRGELVFASELRTLLRSGWVPRRIDPQGLYGYFATGSVPEPRTMIENVRCWPAGHSLSWKEGKIETDRFWTWEFPPEDVADEKATVATVREALLDSVDCHFESDVPVSIFLSGGIDSTVLLALARARGHRHLHTYSIGFDDSHLDESVPARRTAEHFGAEHAEWRLDAGTGRELFHEFLPALDQPSVDGFNTYVVSRFAHERGEKVVLSGLGGDELFGGYPSFQRIPQMLAWGRRLRWLGPVRTAFARWMDRHGSTSARQRLGAYLEGPPTLQRAYGGFRGIFTPREAARLAAQYSGLPPESFREEAEMPDARHFPTVMDAVSVLETERYMRNQLLRDSDVMSMANSLELRVPFVDQRLVETVSRIPARWRLAAGKKILRAAVPEIPEWVTQQPKRGFTFPFEVWATGPWTDLLQRMDKIDGVQPRTWYQKWSVVVFEHWWKQVLG